MVTMAYRKRTIRILTNFGIPTLANRVGQLIGNLEETINTTAERIGELHIVGLMGQVLLDKPCVL